MKGVTSDLAARAIILSCREKFPEKKPRDAELPAQARANVTGRAGLKNGTFSGHIYNGNDNYTVTQVTILLSPKGKENSVESFFDAKEYNVSVTVKPLSNSFFSVSVDPGSGDDVLWNITKVRGYTAR